MRKLILALLKQLLPLLTGALGGVLAGCAVGPNFFA